LWIFFDTTNIILGWKIAEGMQSSCRLEVHIGPETASMLSLDGEHAPAMPFPSSPKIGYPIELAERVMELWQRGIHRSGYGYANVSSSYWSNLLIYEG